MNFGPTTTFALMISGHILGEFAFQPDAMFAGKDGSAKTVSRNIPWQYWMLGHSTIHGVLVGHITGSPLLGLLEVASHFLIDHYRTTDKRITFWQDQVLHVMCKVSWMAVLLDWGV